MYNMHSFSPNIASGVEFFYNFYCSIKHKSINIYTEWLSSTMTKIYIYTVEVDCCSRMVIQEIVCFFVCFFYRLTKILCIGDHFPSTFAMLLPIVPLYISICIWR